MDPLAIVVALLDRLFFVFVVGILASAVLARELLHLSMPQAILPGVAAFGLAFMSRGAAHGFGVSEPPIWWLFAVLVFVQIAVQFLVLRSMQSVVNRFAVAIGLSAIPWVLLVGFFLVSSIVHANPAP